MSVSVFVCMHMRISVCVCIYVHMYICIYIYVYIHIYTYIYLQSHPPTLASLSVSMFVSCLFKAFQSNTTPSFHKESRERPLQCVFRTVTHHVFAHYFIFALVTACMNGLQQHQRCLQVSDYASTAQGACDIDTFAPICHITNFQEVPAAGVA